MQVTEEAPEPNSPRVRIVGLILLGISVAGIFNGKMRLIVYPMGSGAVALLSIPLASVALALLVIGRTSFRIVYTAVIVSIMLLIVVGMLIVPFFIQE